MYITAQPVIYVHASGNKMNIRQIHRSKFKVKYLPSKYFTCVAKVTVCAAAVNGLNNFRVGFLPIVPTTGEAVDIESYPVCGTKIVGVTVGAEVTVNCAASTQQYRYVIVQSVDTSAEALCIAEVCVKEGGQYAITFVLCSNNASLQGIAYPSQIAISMFMIIIFCFYPD